MLTNQAAWKLYERYVAGWKAISNKERAQLVDEVLSEDVKYSTPEHSSAGRETVMADMVAFQEKFPGGRFDVGDVSAHHDVALLTWVLVQSDGTVFAKGHDQLRVSPKGKIKSITTFAPATSEP